MTITTEHDELPATERRHEASADLDDMSTLDLLRLMNAEDARAIDAARAALPQLAALVEEAAERLARGGTVHYFGAGTSGRLGVLDAAELLPTFNLDPGIVTGHIAGGVDALIHPVENSEDSADDGAQAAAPLGVHDIAIGLAASGTTPYVAGALRAARLQGSATALITSNARSPLAELADFFIAVDTGPEILTGSTRLKAGTAEKVLLNGFSTALMVRLGRTWSNLMVSLVATNEKLRHRMVRILSEATGADVIEAQAALDRADGDLKLALVTVLGQTSPDGAREALERSGYSVRAAIGALDGSPQQALFIPTISKEKK